MTAQPILCVCVARSRKPFTEREARYVFTLSESEGIHNVVLYLLFDEYTYTYTYMYQFLCTTYIVLLKYIAFQADPRFVSFLLRRHLKPDVVACRREFNREESRRVRNNPKKNMTGHSREDVTGSENSCNS